MAHILTDAQIAELMADRKPVTPAKLSKLKNDLKPHRTNNSCIVVKTKSKEGRHFIIGATRFTKAGWEMRFSIRLAVIWHNKTINLVRCNGHHNEHKNLLEMNGPSSKLVRIIPRSTCHIHKATERYQNAGQDAESYAETTTAYASFEGAVEYLCSHFGCYDTRFGTQDSQLPFMD